MRRTLLPLGLIAVLLALVAPRLAATRGQAPARVAAPADAVRQNNLGVASMNQQKFEVALDDFDKALAAQPDLILAQVNKAVALLALQRFDDAQQILERVVKADPKNARGWYNLGLLHKGLGNTDQALAAFRRVIELAPDDAHARYFAGLLASQDQHYDVAIQDFTKALDIDPFLISAEFGLARAYQRSGNQDEARAHMERFSRITQEKVASAMSLAYGDQGPLSLAEAGQLPASALAAIPVTFVTTAPQPQVATPLNASIGPGACLIDADGNGTADLVSVSPNPAAKAAALFLNRAGTWVPSQASGLDATGPGIGCSVGDYDNDEHPDLAITAGGGVTLFHNDGKGIFTRGPALDAHGHATGVLFVDFDHDADLDVYVLGGTGPDTMFRNNGDGTFADVTADRGLAGAGADRMATASDLDNDRAIDLIVTGDRGVSIYLNPREGKFISLDASAWSPSPPSSVAGVAVLDFDKDGWMDLAFTHAGAPGLSLWRNEAGKRFARVPLPDLPLDRAYGVAQIDYDNDGWLDLAAAGSKAGRSGIVVLRNVQGSFQDVSAIVGADKASPPAIPRDLLADDVDGDGDADLVVADANGGSVVLRNDGGNAHKSLRLTLKGLNDNRSGLGTKVEVQAGAIWQKFETVGATGYLGSGAPGLLVGLGDNATADVVRLLWPTGVVQDEIQLAADTPHEIQQIDRRGSSCPILFTWNGERFEFISDTIGPAVIGHWVAPGEYDTPDTDELVKVTGDQLKPRDGKLSLHFTEPMEEVNYLDRAKLFAIDHPRGTEVDPNERFAATPPFPVDRVIASRGARLPHGAWDEHGRDLMPALRAADHHFVDNFANAPFKGFAALHALELDLGPLPAGAPVRLLMRGFTDYFTANSMYAADQAKLAVIVPYLEARRADGSWVRVSDDIGFPAGLLRTMVADLTDVLPPGTRRIRIWTNLKVYWDQVLVDTTPDGAVPFVRTEIPLLSARLSFRGYPREVQRGTLSEDLRYDFDAVSATGPYVRHRGYYTRFGDVTPLLTAAEDHFVIFGSGDDVGIDFDARALPPLREGWTRDYFVYLDGFVKDMDFYAAYAQTVAPLPFRAMPGYPYPADISYPASNLDYLLSWDTRAVEDQHPPSYRFRY